jgi:hypothetical protein
VKRGSNRVGQVRPERTPSVTARQFIETWQTSLSIAEVARKVHRSRGCVKVRAYRFRQRGVPLKEFDPVLIELPDWDALAEFARSLVAEADVPTEPKPSHPHGPGDAE